MHEQIDGVAPTAGDRDDAGPDGGGASGGAVLDPTGTDELISVDAGGWGLTWAIDADRRLRQVGVGPKGHHATLDLAARWYPEALPTWGGGDPFRPPALRITHSDGLTTTRLVVVDVQRDGAQNDGAQNDGAQNDGTDEDGAGREHVVVRCRDELRDLSVELHLRTDPASAVLEQWIEIVHDQPAPVRLHDYDSIAPLLLADDLAELCQFGGSGWADEWHWTTELLTAGTKSLASLGGAQPHLQRSPCLLLSPSGPSIEDSGDVLGLSIGWGGNTRFELDVRPAPNPGAPRELRLRAGANPLGADYVLDPGVRFVTPTVAWTWSDSGRHEVTRRFHLWMRAHVLRDAERTRAIVVNNWEATFFDFDEARIVELIDRAADLDADVFLLDDGWFGTQHPRNDDTTSLGDWDPDPVKLPAGLAPLAQAAVDRDIRFGIWLEPEMVNPVSELYAAHPDWIVRDEREPRQHRNQFLLDPLIDEVREFEADVVDRTLAQHDAISYVKWDANRPVTDPGSAALAADRQSNLWVDQVHATWALMDEVVTRHPDVELMLCASGGGRNDHETLRRFHEFWTSDNTDPIARVRMQWACSAFFPAAVMAAHVTRWGERPIEFACSVALSARFGFDLDLGSLSPGDWAACTQAMAVARSTQPLVQRGELHRLISPVDGADRSRAALMYVDEGRTHAVLFGYQLESSEAAPAPVRLRGLEPDRRYRIVDRSITDQTDAPGRGPAPEQRLRGSELMSHGLPWPLDRECSAVILELMLD